MKEIKKKKLTDQQIWEKVREKCVLKAKEIAQKRDKYTCQYCGVGRPQRMTHAHHIFHEGLFKSMSADPDNLIILCASHHQGGMYMRSNDGFNFHNSPRESTEWIMEKYPERYAELKRRSRIPQHLDLIYWQKKLESFSNLKKLTLPLNSAIIKEMEIIIIRYKQPEIEEKCLESVRKFTDLKKHKLTIFDNYEAGNINLGKLWNTLIEASDEEVICLLNSDCVVEEGWERVCEALQASTVGAVGPTTDNCGTTQKGMPRGEIEAIGDLSGFCYVFKKSVWKEVGKFPEDFSFYGQESVFNRKLQDRGYKLMVDRQVFVHHDKGASGAPTEEAYWGAFHYWNYLDRLRILRSIVDKDFKIIIIGGGRDNPFPLHKGMEQACDEFFGANALLLRDIHCIPEILDIFKPDLILNTETKYKEESYEFLKKAKRKGIKTALYFTDLRSPLTDACKAHEELCGDLSPFYDAMFFCSEAHRNVWEQSSKIPVYYLPQGSIQHPKPPKGTKHHILHIGAESPGYYHQNRNSLLADFRRSGVEVTLKNSPIRDLRAEIETKSYGDYHSSDYSLAISMNAEKYSSIRLYNIICAGGLALAFKALGLDDIFKNNEHILWFTTAEEAKKIMERTTEEQREELKLNAFKHGQKHHTLKMRLLNILANLYTEDKSCWANLNNLKKIGKV